MRTQVKAAIAVCAAAAGVIAGTGAAGAAPTNAKNAQTINISCDNGIRGQIVTMGNGNWTPGHLIGSTTVLIPISFGPSTFTARDADGNVIFSGTDPAQTGHAIGRQSGPLVNCTYDSGLVDVTGAPDFPPGTATIEFSGTVRGAVVASH